MKKLYLKMFIIFSFTFILFLLSNTSVFATQLPIVVKDERIGHDISITGLPSSAIDSNYIYIGYVINNFTDGGFQFNVSLLCTDKPLYGITASSGNFTLISKTSTNYKYYYMLNFFKGTSSDYSTIPSSIDLSTLPLKKNGSALRFDSNNGFFWLSGGDTASSPSQLVYSSTPVLDYETDEVVFQGAPVTVEQVIIPEITQVTEITQVMGEVLKIMIPVGLIIFGLGLLIYLMRLVISRVI